MVSYLILVRQTTDTRKTHHVTESIQNCVRCAVHLQHFYTQHLAIATDGSHPGRLRARALEAPRFACAHVMWAYVCSVADGRHGTAAIVRSSIPARLVCGWHWVAGTRSMALTEIAHLFHCTDRFHTKCMGEMHAPVNGLRCMWCTLLHAYICIYQYVVQSSANTRIRKLNAFSPHPPEIYWPCLSGEFMHCDWVPLNGEDD